MLVPDVWFAGQFHHWLAERIRQEGLSQRELARLADINHSTISRLIAGRREPELITALKLLEALDGRS